MRAYYTQPEMRRVKQTEAGPVALEESAAQSAQGVSRGKDTLAAAFRSVQADEAPAPVDPRTTAGVALHGLLIAFADDAASGATLSPVQAQVINDLRGAARKLGDR